MILKRLTINNFKNIPEATLEFCPNVNALLGRNGMGKSNLLDAIYYLSFCKSFSRLPDAKIVTRGESYTMLRGDYERQGQQEQITFGYAEGKRKSFKRQGKEYQRLSEHIGKFPLIIVSPRDMDLVAGHSEERRRFIDIIISQADPIYLDHLIRYGYALQQRNKLLRDHIANPDLYAAVETAMAMSASYIGNARRRFVEAFGDIFARHYHDVSRADERPGLAYAASVGTDTDYLAALEQTRRRDEIVGHTSIGPHRDDLELTLDDMPARSTASQGQSKTFTIAMRLAQYEFLRDATAMKPLLLLDDIFDKLDSDRVANIVDIVNRDIFGQIFITDTNRDHLDSIMQMTGADYRLWEVDSGRFAPITHS